MLDFLFGFNNPKPNKKPKPHIFKDSTGYWGVNAHGCEDNRLIQAAFDWANRQNINILLWRLLGVITK